ncbi:unnamed protein product [Caenorhabditis brenneri]
MFSTPFGTHYLICEFIQFINRLAKISVKQQWGVMIMWLLFNADDFLLLIIVLTAWTEFPPAYLCDKHAAMLQEETMQETDYCVNHTLPHDSLCPSKFFCLVFVLAFHC